nr:putative lineage-restricted protein [Crepidula fornicata]
MTTSLLHGRRLTLLTPLAALFLSLLIASVLCDDGIDSDSKSGTGSLSRLLRSRLSGGSNTGLLLLAKLSRNSQIRLGFLIKLLRSGYFQDPQTLVGRVKRLLRAGYSLRDLDIVFRPVSYWRRFNTFSRSFLRDKCALWGIANPSLYHQYCRSFIG